LITALIALAGFWRATGSDSASGGMRTITVVQTLAGDEIDRTTTKHTTTAQPTTHSSATPSGILRRGQVTLEDRDNFDFELGRVGHGYEHDLLLNGIDPDLGHLTTVRVAMRASTGPSTRAGCVKALSSRRVDRIDHPHLPAGSLVCMTTEEGNVAALRIVRPVTVGNPRLTFAYTLWR